MAGTGPGGTGGQIGSTVQGAVGSFGPIGAAIQMGSQMGTGITSQSDSPLIASLGTGIFNPSSNLDFAMDKDNPIGQRLGAMALPGLAGFFAKKNEQSKPDVPFQDPRQVERLLEVERLQKNIQAGTDPGTQTAIAQGQANVAQTQGRLARATGGATGATVDALIKAQRVGDQTTNQALAGARTQLPFFQNLQQQILNRIEEREFDLRRVEQSQFMAEKAQSEKEANINRQRALGTAISTGAFDPENIQGIAGMFKGANGTAPTGDGSGFVNPNENLDQITIDPNQANPTVVPDLNVGTEVTNINPSPGFGFGFGG